MGHYSDYYEAEAQDAEKKARERGLKELDLELVRIRDTFNSTQLTKVTFILRKYESIMSAFQMFNALLKL